VTYHCRNSLAWEDDKGNTEYSIKLKGDNDVEYHASSPRKLRPNVLIDDCKVNYMFCVLKIYHIYIYCRAFGRNCMENIEIIQICEVFSF
jgi:hypothetical protein